MSKRAKKLETSNPGDITKASLGNSPDKPEPRPEDKTSPPRVDEKPPKKKVTTKTSPKPKKAEKRPTAAGVRVGLYSRMTVGKGGENAI